MRTCGNCKWYERFNGVCCNGDGPYCADFISEEECCKEWEGRKYKDTIK